MAWLLLLLACTCSSPDTPPQGKWFAQQYRTHRFDPSLTEAQREQIEMLEAIGYADGTVEHSGISSVTVHDPARAWQGYNFYNSGHGPEAILMDMDGRELHRWRHDFWDAFPRYPVSRSHGSTHNFRRAWLQPNGDVLAIHEGLGLIRINKDSQLVWANPGRMHHDLDFGADGTIHVLSREARIVPRIDPNDPILEDFLSLVDPRTGEERDRISLLEALERSEFASFLDDRPDKADIFHTNTVVVLDGTAADRHPAFQAGNVLLSIRNLSALAVLDPEARKIVWAHRGRYRYQHDPTIARDGRLLLFDNLGAGRGRARVLAFELPRMRTVWSYEGGDRPLSSDTLGAVTELPNGNLLVTESEQGRAFELVPDSKEVVWEFYNPHVAGPHGEYVAALFEVMRLPPDFPVDWAEGASR